MLPTDGDSVAAAAPACAAAGPPASQRMSAHTQPALAGPARPGAYRQRPHKQQAPAPLGRRILDHPWPHRGAARVRADQPLGPTSHWQSIDDPNGADSTVVNGINAAGDLQLRCHSHSGGAGGYDECCRTVSVLDA
jgi:hypothetical protein